MKKRRPISVVQPEQSLPFDPLEFRLTLMFAMEAGRKPSAGFRPTELKLRLKEEDGTSKTLQFTDIPINRFGVAVLQRYGKRTKKYSSFMFRVFALMDLIHSDALRPYYYRPAQREGEPSELHDAVLDVAASHPLTTEGGFERGSFLEALAKASARYEPTPPP
jgi:hypothetical protein